MPDDQKQKATKSQADQSIAHLRCSKCLRNDVLHFNTQRLMFECVSCGSDFLNPYAIGPWDTRVAIVDRFPSGDVVSSYILTNKDTEPAEPNDNFIEFVKTYYAREDLRNRKIKDDWGLPAQAKKKRAPRKKKVEVTQEAE